MKKQLLGSLLACFLGAITHCEAQLLARPGRPVTEIPVAPPPMGWSSWNSFSNRIDSKITMEQARALVSSGMAGHGYRYVNIDEGWWLGKRDVGGNILVDPHQWPAIVPGEKAGDMANIVRYIHSLGLKAGIYTDAGADGCSYYGPDLGPKMPHTGSEGHYHQDFLQFARWGFDYVKVDWCGGSNENLDPAQQYAEIARAIRKAELETGHALYYSICNWGANSPWTWAPGVGGVIADIWRTSGDIVAPIVADSPNSSRKASFEGMLGNFEKGIHPEAQHTGFYNDPDMMVLGMPGLTDAQNRVHMALWAISGAPLLVGADLTTLTKETLAQLTNPEVLSIDQDPLGLQAVRVSEPEDKVEIWVKRLAGSASASGRRAVVLLNRTDISQSASVRWDRIGLEPSSATVHDSWTGHDFGAQPILFTANVPGGDAQLLMVEGSESLGMEYEAASVAATNAHPSLWEIGAVKAGTRNAWLRVVYSNTGTSPALLEFSVNGERQSMLAFAPTGSSKAASLTLECLLPDQVNTLSFRASDPNQVDIFSIEVLPFGR